MARPLRHPAPQILHQQAGSTRPRVRRERDCPPKNQGGAETIARILIARYPENSVYRRAARFIIAASGSTCPHKLTAAQVIEMDDAIARRGYKASTRYTMASATRQILRWLWEVHDAPKLDRHIRQYMGIRPRNVTATRAEIDSLLDAATPGMRLWILFCSDLAIRSGTAATLAPANYNPELRQVRFVTKHGAHVTLPVTQEIRELIEQCQQDSSIPFVRQLWNRDRPANTRPTTEHFDSAGKLREHFRELCLSVGITRHLIPHDLRRTAAVAMLEYTGDVRDVQALLGHRNLPSTLWYLDHDVRQVNRAALETIKKPNWRKDRTA